jgi:hypothetical protein
MHTIAPVYPNVATSTVPPSARGRRNVPWAHDARTRVADAARKKALSVKPMLKEEKQKSGKVSEKGACYRGLVKTRECTIETKRVPDLQPSQERREKKKTVRPLNPLVTSRAGGS